MLAPIHGNHAKRVSEFVTNRDVIGSLSNLERIGHIRRTRHARQKTVRFGGVGGHPLCAAFLPFSQPPGLVPDFTALHHTPAPPDAPLPSPIPDVPRRPVQNLPKNL